MSDIFHVLCNLQKKVFFFGREWMGWGGEIGEQEKFVLTENSDLRQMPHCKKTLKNFRTGTLQDSEQKIKKVSVDKVNCEFLGHFVKTK